MNPLKAASCHLCYDWFMCQLCLLISKSTCVYITNGISNENGSYIFHFDYLQ